LNSIEKFRPRTNRPTSDRRMKNPEIPNHQFRWPTMFRWGSR
jgi:hypothetical protein